VPLPQIDVTLARFGSAIEVMTSNLIELDSNPTNKLLDPKGLTGATATRIATARQTLERLWGQFAQFKELVERAQAMRNGHPSLSRIAEIDRLLHGPSISLPPIEVALADRGLLTPAETAVSTTPDQLLADMVTAFDNAKHEILAVDEAWRVLVPRLGTAQGQIARLTRVAADLGETTDPLLARAHETVQELGRTVTTDPLSVDSAVISALEASVASLASKLDGLARRRDTLATELEGAQVMLGEIDRAIDEGTVALAESRAKVANAGGLLEPLDRVCLSDERHGLRPWLARLVGLEGAGDWRTARRGLDQWTQVADATLAAARQVAAANSAPLQQRNELRGRLDAFCAKAAQLGRTEEQGLSELLSQARACLFTAPTDLTAALALVTRYGAALATSPPSPAPSGPPDARSPAP
jgi:hypothetical protein